MQWIKEAPVGAISIQPAVEAVNDYILGSNSRQAHGGKIISPATLGIVNSRISGDLTGKKMSSFLPVD